jgi:hypothetical protein
MNATNAAMAILLIAHVGHFLVKKFERSKPAHLALRMMPRA